MPTRALAPARTEKPRSMRVSPLLIIGAGAVAAATVFAALAAIILLALATPRIPNGVSVAGVALGGRTREQAAALLSPLTNAPLTLTDNAQSYALTPAELGLALDVEGTLITAREAAANTTIAPRYTVDLNRAQQALVALSGQVNREATTDAPGRLMDIPVTLDRLRADASAELADGVIALDLIETPVLPPPEPVFNYDGPTSTHIVAGGEELGLIARRYNVLISDIAAMNDITDPNLIYPGQELTIPAAGVYEPATVDAPPAPQSSGRAILVSITNQRIYAYENGQLVHSQLVSTGLPETPTVLGDYRVYVKHTATDMRGPGYYLPGVPYTMYFFQGYAIHGTYWHNNFGRPMSHGCVNLPVDQAQWFFNFAEVGTLVRVMA